MYRRLSICQALWPCLRYETKRLALRRSPAPRRGGFRSGRRAGRVRDLREPQRGRVEPLAVPVDVRLQTLALQPLRAREQTERPRKRGLSVETTTVTPVTRAGSPRRRGRCRCPPAGGHSAPRDTRATRTPRLRPPSR